MRKGQKHTAQTRRKMSEAWKHRTPASDESRAKMSASAHAHWGTEEERFMLHVRKTRGCWWWEGQTTKRGYGTSSGSRKAHRISYRLFVGDLIPGHHIHHVCHNKLCVKPDHLFQLTPDEHRDGHNHPERWERYLIGRSS